MAQYPGLPDVLAALLDVTNSLFRIGGNVAAGVTDAGNPVKVGGKYNASPPALTDGWRGDLQLDANGNLRIAQSGSSSTTPTGAANLATTQPAPTTGATTLAVARATRTRCVILNRGMTQVYVGPATVTAGNGFLLDPGASLTLTSPVLIQGISIGATGLCYVADEYN